MVFMLFMALWLLMCNVCGCLGFKLYSLTAWVYTQWLNGLVSVGLAGVWVLASVGVLAGVGVLGVSWCRGVS